MVEMKEEFKLLKEVFLKNNWEWEESERLFTCISVKVKDDMYLYNYNNNVLVDRNHPVLIRCRGLVINKKGKVLNYPFDRFFNEFEKECKPIDWETATIQNKEDGSLISVFWNDNDWEVTTRGSFYPIEGQHVDYAQLFYSLFKRFRMLHKDNCYMFELITKQNRIVKWYDEEIIYLLGVRNLNTFQEINQITLNDFAEDILEVKRPKMYNANNIKGCKKLFEKFKDDDEGLVIVDKNFNRMKIKQESYIKLSKIKMLKEQDIFDYVLGKTQIDNEYLEKLPDVMETVNIMKDYWIEIRKEILEVFEKIKDKPTRKEFALECLKYPYKSVLFSLIDNKGIPTYLKWDNVKTWNVKLFK